MGLITVGLDKRGFATPITPVSSQGMMRYAVDLETKLNSYLNGTLAANRTLFTTPSAKTISAGAITPTLAMHTVTSESGTSDDLDTITAVNNSFLVLKATAGHTIQIRNAAGNVTVPGGNNISLSGNRAVLLWCENSAWSHVGTAANKNNFSATSDPGSGDDSGDAYVVGSLWVNTALDRIWICVDNTLTTAIWKIVGDWLNGWSARGAAAAVPGVGIEDPTLNTPGAGASSRNDSTGTFVLVTTAASAGSIAGIVTTTFNLVRPSYSPVVEMMIATTGSIAARFWAGLTDTQVTNADTLTTTKFIGFRSNGAAGWVPVLNDGTTQGEGTQIGTVAINTTYLLRVRVDNVLSTAYFSVNNGAEQAVSSHFPSASSDLGLTMSVIAGGAATRTLALSYAQVNW